VRSAAIVNSGQHGLSREKGLQNPKPRPIGRRTGYTKSSMIDSDHRRATTTTSTTASEPHHHHVIIPIVNCALALIFQ
jgi:hypothetical protein